MSFHTSECDRTVPDELSSRPDAYDDGEASEDNISASRPNSRPARSVATSSLYEFRQPPGDGDDPPIRDDILTTNELAKMQLSPKLRKTPIPAEYLRTSVSPRAKQQFVRFESDLAAEVQADIMARTSPKKNTPGSKLKQPIDMRLRSNMVHIGGCWGSVDLSEAVDFKPRKRQDIRVINPIVPPGRTGGQRVVFRPSNGQDFEPEFPKHLV